MKQTGTVCIFAVVLCASPAGAAEFKLGNHTFTVPEGFEVELAAAPSEKITAYL